MILGIMLNPSLIKTSIVDGFELNKENEIIDYTIEFDNGPLHAVHTIKTLQGEPLMVGFMGGPGGRYIKHYLEKVKIRSDFTWKDEEIRNTQIIIDATKGTETFLMDQGISVDDKDIRIFFQKLQNHLSDVSMILLSGQLPRGIELEDIKRIMDIAVEKGKKVVVGLEGLYLKKALESKPYAVFLNEKSLIDLGVEEVDRQEILKKVYQLLKEYHIKIIALDMGNGGIYTFTKNKICRGYYPLTIKDGHKKGVQDAVLGCFAISLDRQYEQEKMSKLMCAVAVAARSRISNELCQRKEIDYYNKKSKVEEIMSKSKGFVKISQ